MARISAPLSQSENTLRARARRTISCWRRMHPTEASSLFSLDRVFDGSWNSRGAEFRNLRRPLFVQVPHEPVLLVDENYLRVDRRFAQLKSHDDDFFTRPNQVGSRAVHANVS